MKVVVNTNRSVASINTTKPSIIVNQNTFGKVSMGDLLDVDLTGIEDGAVLVYNMSREKFEAVRDLEKQNINGGHF